MEDINTANVGFEKDIYVVRRIRCAEISPKYRYSPMRDVDRQ